MAGQDVKRSSHAVLAGAADALAAHAPAGPADPQGVGGRRPPGAPPLRGGGYLGICTVSKLSPADSRDRDPRLDELRAMGMPSVWLQIAADHAVGFDAFLAMWKRLDAEPSFRSDNGDLDIRMRSFRSYLRYQRNRYIEELCSAGMTARDIQEAVHLHLCERISIRHISRIKSGG